MKNLLCCLLFLLPLLSLFAQQSEYNFPINAFNFQLNSEDVKFLDIGIRTGVRDSDTGIFAIGVSAGGFWRGNDKAGGYVKLAGDYLLNKYGLYLGADSKLGLGKGSFISIQPKAGFCIGPFYAAVGVELMTGSPVALTGQIGAVYLAPL
jgi:hypothetical protein